ncbi:LysR family transcriptional regulator [Dongia deserti]|uniref:LysR family transcriptional regulator n=1 Tax=Dongia deserti TaxID=2268030 RepID=UPI000E65BAA5|nr:LysR family transcriptional regulator [Dongia deserti]
MLDALTLDQMRVFVAVAESGSFRSAAQRLSRAQSAVSHAIGNIEAQLCTALFDRTNHRPTLTAEGDALLADARAILLKVDAMRARAQGFRAGIERTLSFVVDTLFPLPIVGAALRDLRDAYPTVSARLSLEPLGGPLAALRERRCSLAIMAGEDFRDPRIELERLMSFSFVAVVAADHPLAERARRKEPLGTIELADHLQIVQEDPTLLSGGRDFGVLSPGTWRVRGQDTKHALILAGVGWGRLPLWQVEQDLAEGRLVRVPTAALGHRGDSIVNGYLARRTDEPLGPAAVCLREALARHCGEQRVGQVTRKTAQSRRERKNAPRR